MISYLIRGRIFVRQDPSLAHSNVSPRAVNGSILDPVGKIPKVAFCTNGKTVHDDVHIYAGALISYIQHRSTVFYQIATPGLWDSLTPLALLTTLRAL